MVGKKKNEDVIEQGEREATTVANDFSAVNVATITSQQDQWVGGGGGEGSELTDIWLISAREHVVTFPPLERLGRLRDGDTKRAT